MNGLPLCLARTVHVYMIHVLELFFQACVNNLQRTCNRN